MKLPHGRHRAFLNSRRSMNQHQLNVRPNPHFHSLPGPVSNFTMGWVGYIDFGDGCWRPNVLVTRFWCWWQVTSPTSRVRHQHHILAYYNVGDRCKSPRIYLKILLNLAPGWISCLQHNISVTNITFWHILAYYVGDRLECHQHAEKCHQHTFFVNNILKWSPSLSHQHNDVINITVTAYNL